MMKKVLFLILGVFLIFMPYKSYATTENNFSVVKISLLKNDLDTFIKKVEFHPFPKSQIVALILAILLGNFGVHRFYLGYYLIGLLQLMLFLIAEINFFVLLLSSLGGYGNPIFFLVAWLLVMISTTWMILDIIRIICGTLKPVDGDYDKKFK